MCPVEEKPKPVTEVQNPRSSQVLKQFSALILLPLLPPPLPSPLCFSCVSDYCSVLGRLEAVEKARLAPSPIQLGVLQPFEFGFWFYIYIYI